MPTIEELDKEFEEKLKALNGDPVNTEATSTEEPEGEETTEEEKPGVEVPAKVTPEKPEENPEETPDPAGDKKFVATQPTAEEKQKFAFEKMRRELAAERDEKKRLAQVKQEADELAQYLGYKNSEEMIAAEKKNRIAKEAKDKGVAPELYQELVQLREDVKSLRSQKEEDAKKVGIKRFGDAVNDAVKTYGMTEEDKAKMFDALAEDGYTVDMLIGIPNPSKLLKGYIPEEKLTEKGKQSALSQKGKFVEPAHKGQTAVTDEDKYQRELDEEMAQYAERYGYPYNRKYPK